MSQKRFSQFLDWELDMLDIILRKAYKQPSQFDDWGEEGAYDMYQEVLEEIKTRKEASSSEHK